MKLKIKLEIAPNANQVAPDPDKPWNNTCRFSDGYEQTIEFGDNEAVANQRVANVIMAFNGFSS